MPVSKNSELISPFWLPNGHFQSIYPTLFRKISGVAYHRERISTSDGDFLDLDWSYVDESSGRKGKLVVLSHGLEGNSTRQYVLGMVRLLNQNGYDCLAWNFRSCSGEMNQTSRFYHSGATEDLQHVVGYAVDKGYKDISLIGFSLGGNLTLKFLGESAAGAGFVSKAIVFSVPMDLKACSLSIIKPENRIYMHRFLNTLRPKIEEKSSLFPDRISLSDHQLVRTLYDFDDIYTAPLHGFAGADDYYDKCSSMHFVRNIQIPTLIVNAENDPIVPSSSLPMDLISPLTHVHLEITDQGGHCGFRPSHLRNGIYWSESRALRFLQQDS